MKINLPKRRTLVRCVTSLNKASTNFNLLLLGPYRTLWVRRATSFIHTLNKASKSFNLLLLGP